MTDFKAVIRLCSGAGIEFVIRVKRAAGRPKDLDALAGLEALLEERGKHSNG